MQFLSSLLLHLLYKSRLLIPQRKSATTATNCYTATAIFWLIFPLMQFSRASDISRKKKQNFAGFSGANSRENRPISWDFRRKKVKICRKIGPFRGILAEKSQFSKDFQGQILRKVGRFHGKCWGETSPRNN